MGFGDKADLNPVPAFGQRIDPSSRGNAFIQGEHSSGGGGPTHSESRTRNRGNVEYGYEFEGFHNNGNAPLREKRGGFYTEGSFGNATRRDGVDREHYPTHDDRFEFKEKQRGLVPTMENKNFAKDGYESARSAVGSREFGYRKVDASSATNTFGGFCRPGFGVNDNLRHDRHDSFYDENNAFNLDRGGKDRASYGGQRIEYSRTRQQCSPMERGGFKRSTSPESFRKSGDMFGNDSRKEDSRFGQPQRYDQEHFNDWDSSGRNTFGGRSEFGRSFSSQRNVPQFGAPAGNETSEKKRAPKDWEPEETSIGTLFERDFSNSEYLDKEQDDCVTVDGVQNYTLISSWESSGLNPKLVKTCIEKCNYKHVRPIQAATIPLVLDGYDVMAHAETGGGKTAAFVLPILHQILASGDRKSLRCGSILALVIAPTRELARQLYDMFRKHAFETEIRCCVAYGEIPRWKNLAEIHKGCDVLIGTSGRLMDFIEKCDVNISTLRFLVLDEADMLLEDGRQNHIRSILDNPALPKVDSRQTLLFSATFPENVEQLARDIMRKKYAKVSNGARNRANARVVQLFEKVNGGSCEKNEKLFEILQKQRDNPDEDNSVKRTLVFVGSKHQADFLALVLINRDIKAGSINSNRPQDERERLVKQLRDGSLHVLVGTDVCQRGLDIHGLDHVINYDLPHGSPHEIVNKYIHRIGRTGRLHGGFATTFIDSSVDSGIVKLLTKVAAETNQKIPMWLEEMSGQNTSDNLSFGFSGGHGWPVKSEEATLTNSNCDDCGELGSAGFNVETTSE
ncbi:unnamed protein product [Angiostrongylus costaricensis]|uniref:RNA helicase n=1 Tax=Angiostrongylus costaricensis TaxID=334426 RepID=A0A158PI79_ANGCS|nr:unnamed protein product [Angiostrongylus costaricensis]